MTNKNFKWIIISVIALVIVGMFVQKNYDIFSIAVIPNLASLNPSFETDSGWTVYNYGAPSVSSGEYSTSWATNGLRSFHLRASNPSYSVCLYQSINISNATSISFDINPVVPTSSVRVIYGTNKCSGSVLGNLNIVGNRATLNFTTTKDIQTLGIHLSGGGEVFLDNMVLTYSTTCIPSWSCNNWGPCPTGTQTRQCFDFHYCGTLEGRPALSQTCTPTPQNTEADTNSDGIISFQELTAYGSLWISGSKTFAQLMTVGAAWAG